VLAGNFPEPRITYLIPLGNSAAGWRCFSQVRNSIPGAS
jgi:hypothetical protein